ncbi:LPS-assembly protein LptD [Mangrovicella endophytica]|uniref:LPS-assembly protein LptD n=1 Tax=Mangrovicella endophytica TaxID=2066697 RepID=UPI000C9E09DF|nr:LPS-assembly protein LptD [Mangrovicella endophytica]
MDVRGIGRGRAGALQRQIRAALLAGTAFAALVTFSAEALAQSGPAGLGAAVSVPEGSQLFLESDTVTYDSDTAVVTADGSVRIDYGGYKLVARKVVYNQKTRRLIASGDVELQQPDGNRVFADSADITDDFGQGFIKALRIETPDNTRFAAAEAIRQNGEVTTFQQGVYTACEPCREHPERAPLWQVKAKKIVWNQREKVVRYYGAKFELFGAPIAYLPYFQSPDPTVKRKSGFLTPSFEQKEELGYGVKIPYFWAISDDKDLTVAGTYYSKQGFLAEAEYRQAFGNGYFTLQAAGISQRDPDEFYNPNPFIVEQSPDYTTDRGMIGTTGRFALSDRWTFGWDWLLQSDDDFSATYDIQNFSSTRHISEIYLTGLGDRSFFDLRTQRFDVQSENPLQNEIQPDVLPTFDYQRIEETPGIGGEVQLDVNVTSLNRDNGDPSSALVCTALNEDGVCDRTVAFPDLYSRDFFRRTALEGDYSRATTQLSWRNEIITSGGLVLTPRLSARGDLYTADMSLEDIGVYETGIDVDESGARGMTTASLMARYPYLIQTGTMSHVIEPIGQIIIRPDEAKSGILPNEDAQELVFNTGNLFQEDKFSGYDRIEGGTRANVGLRYVGTLETGYSIDAMVGQSYHLGGENPFAQDDLALIGYESGLETDRSDYVSSLSLATPFGLGLGLQNRFDEEDFELKRSDVFATLTTGALTAGLTYSEIAAQPISGFPDDRSQVRTTASYKLSKEWTAFGALGYDVENSAVIERSFGIGYADECFSLIAAYKSTTDRYQEDPSETTLLFRVGLRTIADTDFSYDLGGDDDDG